MVGDQVAVSGHADPSVSVWEAADEGLVEIHVNPRLLVGKRFVRIVVLYFLTKDMSDQGLEELITRFRRLQDLSMPFEFVYDLEVTTFLFL